MADEGAISEQQLRTLDRLKALLEPSAYYLAGGTAIAYHLGHRRSRDLDLFSVGPIDIERVRRVLLSDAEHGEVEVVSVSDAALELIMDGVMVDVVSYPHPPLVAPVPGPASFATAGLLDLATMKLAAVARRGIRRDFWDLFAILTQSPVTLDTALGAYRRRFGREESDTYHVLRALTFFEDAEADEAPLEGMTPELWTQIRAYFTREAAAALRRLVADR